MKDYIHRASMNIYDWIITNTCRWNSFLPTNFYKDLKNRLDIIFSELEDNIKIEHSNSTYRILTNILFGIPSGCIYKIQKFINNNWIDLTRKDCYMTTFEYDNKGNQKLDIDSSKEIAYFTKIDTARSCIDYMIKMEDDIIDTWKVIEYR